MGLAEQALQKGTASATHALQSPGVEALSRLVGQTVVPLCRARPQGAWRRRPSHCRSRNQELVPDYGSALLALAAVHACLKIRNVAIVSKVGNMRILPERRDLVGFSFDQEMPLPDNKRQMRTMVFTRLFALGTQAASFLHSLEKPLGPNGQ